MQEVVCGTAQAPPFGTVEGQPDDNCVHAAGTGATVHLPLPQAAVDRQYVTG
jgi:hypothetical protein